MSLSNIEESNKINYKAALEPYLEEIKPFFEYETCEFNTQGGFGLELIKENNTIFIWLIDSNNPNEDLLPENFNNSNTNYKIAIQTEFIDNQDTKVNTFEDISTLVKYLAEINNNLSIEESKDLIKELQNSSQTKMNLGN